MGKGLFALVLIKKGDFILEYTGERIPTEVADDRKSRYIFELDKDWAIDGQSFENTARYINHACDPNCEVIIEDEHINIYAVRDIPKGEELTFDYGEEYFDEFIKPNGCKCESLKHR